MLTINGNKFASDENEFVSSLFDNGGTCIGFYRKYKRRIIFSDMQGNPFAALIKNKHNESLLVNCGTAPNGSLRYQFALSSNHYPTFGLDPDSYLKQCEQTEKLTATLL